VSSSSFAVLRDTGAVAVGGDAPRRLAGAAEVSFVGSGRSDEQILSKRGCEGGLCVQTYLSSALWQILMRILALWTLKP
jgi:hypothetical protein